MRPLAYRDSVAQRARTGYLPSELRERVDLLRVDASRRLVPERRAEFGQFLTPIGVAGLMASMFELASDEVRLLDPGAGVGSLFAATVAELCQRPKKPSRISITAYELDPMLADYLPDTLELCRACCEAFGIEFKGEIRRDDFVEQAVGIAEGSLFASAEAWDAAIVNPPYGKIRTDSATRSLLRHLGVETSNAYTAFLAATIALLRPSGELVAITPRSFCNGVYFRGFRRFFLERVALRRAHVFESRKTAFHEDGVLQENVIVHAVKQPGAPEKVVVTASVGPDDDLMSSWSLDYGDVVRPDDPERFIRIVPDDLSRRVAQQMEGLPCTLGDLGLTVSTGRVVDFRARDLLQADPGPGSVPLIYPSHFDHGYVTWPKPGGRKPNAIARAGAAARTLLVPGGCYVLVRRFSTKEERRRLVAAVCDPQRLPAESFGFENHLNYFHERGQGLEPTLARGLAGFLNSTLADAYFRQFSGHTQVNAVDLRTMRYPTLAQLRALGENIGPAFPDQDALDALVERELVTTGENETNPVRAKKRIDEGIGLLRVLGLPREQINERSALVLLALLELRPETPWAQAGSPLMGITPIMEFAAAHYGKNYAPNTRETVRRFTMHQFVAAGLAVLNPDQPDRAVNSPKVVYQIEAGALDLLRSYGSAEWDQNLRTYLASVETLKKRYAQERALTKIPLRLAEGKTIALAPGGQNVLIKQVWDEFAPRWVPGGIPLYVGDTGQKFAHFDEQGLAELGVRIEAHGKMPDVIILDPERGWLILIEAVTSHGPVNPKRREELERLFAGSTAGLVLVTAFLDRKALTTYLGEISWETEVWVAEEPDHLIHFNGERFLGPH